MSPELLDTIQSSPLTPWVGGALLFFLAIGLIKFIAKTIGKLIVTAVLGCCAFFGWNWWNEPDPRGYGDIGSDWFQSVKSTDFSKASLQNLAQDTSRLLKEATETSRAQGREVAKGALAKMAESLKEKMEQAGQQGEAEAKRELEEMRRTIMARIQ